MSELLDHCLVSFYKILDGRVDFVDALYECGFSMNGFVDAAVANNDIQLITHLLNKKMYAVNDIICNLTTDNITGDMTPMFNFLVARGVFLLTKNINEASDLFIMTDNAVMMRWMDTRGLLSHDNSRFRYAILCESLDVARWLVENGHYEPNHLLVKVRQNGDKYEEIMVFLNGLYAKK